PSPSPSVSDQQRVLAAMLTRDEVAKYGLNVAQGPVSVLPNETSRPSLGKPCGQRLASDGRISSAAQADLYTSDGDVHLQVHQVLARYRAAGTTTVQEVEQALTCSHDTDAVGLATTVTGKISVPQAPGVERQVAYCEDDPEMGSRHCYVFAAQGNYAMMLDFQAVSRNRADAKKLLDQRVPALTPALETVLSRG
ncbi:hypothetical protein, partial [Amycolatopsis bartoniae]